MENHMNIQRASQAWLITWEWIGDHAKVNNKVIAIISGRKSQSNIQKIVELLWASSRLTWSEQTAYARHSNHLAYHAEERPLFEGSVTCGHNPWIEARRVYEIEAYMDDEGIEHLQGKYWKPTMKDEQVESKFVLFHIAKNLDGSIQNIDD